MSKNKLFLSFLLSGSLLCLFACANRAASREAPSAADDSPGSLLSETESLFAENIPHGSIIHGSDSKTFTYTGGTLELPYYAEGSGLGTNCGFLLFLDGIPQPYRIESEGSCAYLHLLSLTDNVRKNFSFYLEPVTGKAGETLTLTILSLNPQSYEGTKELPLGTSQNFLENYVSLTFEADVPTGADVVRAEPDAVPIEADVIRAEPDAVPEEADVIRAEADVIRAEPDAVPAETDAAHIEPAADSGLPILKYLSVSEEELTPESIDRYLSDGTGTSTSPVSELSTRVFQNCSLSRDGAGLSHILLGHPGARYRTTLFLDYILLWCEGSSCADRNLKSGLASRLDAGFDSGALEGTHILSVLSVPLNASDFPNDVLITETWSAIPGDEQ